MNTWYDNIEKKMYSGVVFLDLAKAFDTVDYRILLHKLEHYSIKGIVLQLYQSFLENRKQLESIYKLVLRYVMLTLDFPSVQHLGLCCSYHISMIFLTVLVVYLACLQVTPAYLSIHLL